MSDVREKRSGPLVSVVLLCGRSPGPHLAAALRSAIQQTYANVEVLLVGGDGQAERVIAAAATDDPRVVVPLAPAAAGKAAALNNALAHARGMYVCYLHEDDLLHPQHVATLTAALEGPTDSRAAYADVYRTICQPAAGGGQREVLGKILREARDFDPFLLLHRNYIPLTGLMHRRDLIERAGAFRTDLRAMIEWDLIRRLAFFTDFLHVTAVTAETYAADEDADSDRDVDVDGQPLGPEELAEETCKVWAARPPKPWPAMHDLSVILAPADEESDLPGRLAEIRHVAAVPHTVYLAAPSACPSRATGRGTPAWTGPSSPAKATAWPCCRSAAGWRPRGSPRRCTP